MSISRLDVEKRTVDVVKSLEKVRSDRVSLDTQFSDIALDDLDVIDLILAVEDEFGIEIPESVSAGFTTFRDVANYVFSCTDAG